MFKVNSSKLRAMLFERGLSVSEFAKAANINAVTARKLFNDGATVNAKVIAALAKFFDVNGNELLKEEE